VTESELWVHNSCWEKLVKFKYENFSKLGAQEQQKALSLIDSFQLKYLNGIGAKSVTDIRNVNNLRDGLFEIKGTGANAVRVYIDKVGNVLGFSNKKNQNKTINKIKSLLSGDTK